MDKVDTYILEAFVSQKDRITIDVVPMNSIIRRVSRRLGRKRAITAKDVRRILGNYNMKSSRIPAELKSRYGARCYTTTNKAYDKIRLDLEDL